MPIGIYPQKISIPDKNAVIIIVRKHAKQLNIFLKRRGEIYAICSW
jgi:hypothetical protein